MKAVRLHGIGDVRLDEIAAPPEPGPGQVVVAPLWCGLCGTDAREYLGPGGSIPDEPHPLTGVSKPVVLGHEFSARVVAAGPGVRAPLVGETVAVLPLEGCGACVSCHRGQPLLCRDKAWIGLSTRYGGLGDLALVRAEQAVPIGAMSPVDGALVEPTAVALHAVLRAGVRPGDTVLVAGCGPIGLLTAACSLAAGADRVFAYDPRTELAGTIAALGAEPLPDGPLEERLALLAARVPDGVAVAFDCAGKPDSLALCMGAVCPDGTVCIPSVHTTPRELNVWAVTRNALHLVGSLGYTPKTWARAIALIEAGRLPVGMLASHTIERDQVALALGGLPSAEPKLKVLVRVGAE